MNHEDYDGNGIWHYLADTLRQHEGASTLKIARTLLAMDIDFSRRNKNGQSPLFKMLVPTPRWQSLNALIQTKHLSIENIERAVAEGTPEEAERNHVMSMIFSRDIAENRGLLSQHVLRQAVQPQADVTLRAATCRLFFEYFDVETGGTAFFDLIGIANHAMFDDLMRLLMTNTAEMVRKIGAPDTATAKSYAQAYLAQKLLRRKKNGQGVLFVALFAQKHMHMRKITSLLHNDELVIKKIVRGDTVRKEMVIDKTSPAPTNPLLSMLLQQDLDGNTVFHHATMQGDLQALKWLFSGLAPNDIHAIILSVPNKLGLSLIELTQLETVKAHLTQAVMQKRMRPEQAIAYLRALPGENADVAGFLTSKVNEIEELAKSVGRKEPLPPTFQIRKAP
ncbi:ankyrin repeat domain-containing protein [Magnetospirillum molischianum]|uniref:ankyrin repeat domain-containing protein n=1 Tax=Magnetospirillum molischianum TaxID=1083 RepID=UPI001F42443E|nr:ankyrin repeat domain-containing protein [Magnetospirillum molischianum]